MQVNRPWGGYDVLYTGEHHVVKILVILPEQSISLQKHMLRNEHWTVLHGYGKFIVNEETGLFEENDTLQIDSGDVHRATNIGTIPLIILEIQTGDKVSEDDIIRFEDQYGRAE
jgi:mannose-1-phosphate guanylyltransferase/mannose-6-phosphate isomerase